VCDKKGSERFLARMLERQKRWRNLKQTRRYQMKIAFATKLMAVTFSLVLIAVPAFAEIADFHAMSAVAVDEQAPVLMTDEQLAAVEGGDHLTTAAVLLAQVLSLNNAIPGINGLGNRELGQAIANSMQAAAAFLLTIPAHPIGAAGTNP
jgi:hypothetical protein